LADAVQDGDRVEIYRPLIADPKELRRKRAEKADDE
ncbi:RnfH family protein, partial [Pseudescherichia sp.]